MNDFSFRRFVEDLSPFFMQNGYLYHHGFMQFRKTYNSGFQNVIFAPVQYEDEVRLEVTFGSRVNPVEELIQDCTNGLNDFKSHSNTTGISFGKYHREPYFRLRFRDEKSYLTTLNTLKQFFDEEGFEYLNRLSDTGYLDSLFNAFPGEPCEEAFNPRLRCFRGLATAYLNNNPELELLAKAYPKVLKKYGATPVELQQFEALTRYCRHYKLNWACAKYRLTYKTYRLFNLTARIPFWRCLEWYLLRLLP